MSKRPLPPPGTLLSVEITDVSSQGMGVGRGAGGLVVMARGAVPGDLADVRVRVTRRGHVEAEVENLNRPSPHRVEPRCAHFGACGGCSLQNLQPVEQRRLKAERLRQQLRRIGGMDSVPVADTRVVGPDYGFRNRMEFTFATGPEGLQLGLHTHDGEVFDLMECHLPGADFAGLLVRIRQLARDCGALAFEPGSGKGELVRLQLRHSRKGGMLLALVVARRPPAILEQGLVSLAASHGAPLTIAVIRPQRPGGRLEQASVRVLTGSGEIREELNGVTIPVDPLHFVQTHTAGAQALYRQAAEWLAPAAGGALLDLYAGNGVLSLLLAPKFPRVTAVESSRAAVTAGRRASREAGRQIRFARADAQAEVRRLVAAGKKFTAIALNPPRGGLPAAMPELLQRLAPRRLVYTSCDGGTLARDLGRLWASGLTATQVMPFDLFPQTARVEAMALIRTDPAAGRR